MKKKKLKKLVKKLRSERDRYWVERDILIDAPDSFEAEGIRVTKILGDAVITQAMVGSPGESPSTKGLWSFIEEKASSE